MRGCASVSAKLAVILAVIGRPRHLRTPNPKVRVRLPARAPSCVLMRLIRGKGVQAQGFGSELEKPSFRVPSGHVCGLTAMMVSNAEVGKDSLH